MIAGATDAGYAALESDAAILDSFGPRGDGDNEHIVTELIEPRLYLVARMLIELGEQ